MSSSANLTWRDDYDIGATVAVKTANRKTHPFDQESFKTFQSSFNNKEEKGDFVPGQYIAQSTLAMDSSKKNDTLDVSAKLGVTYGPVSVDASVSYAKESTTGSLSVSFIYYGSSEGIKLKADPTDLKLDEALTKKIDDGSLKFQNFKDLYGDHVVVGKVYGAKIILCKTYECSTQGSKQSIGASLKGQYGKAGFGVSVEGEMKKTDSYSAQKTNVTNTFRFIGCDPGSKEAKNITEAINSIGKGSSGDDEKSEEKNWANEIDQNAQTLLTRDKLAPSDAIIIPIDAIPCIAHAFVNEIVGGPGAALSAQLFPRLNATFFAIKSIQKDSKTICDALTIIRNDEGNKDLWDEAKTQQDFVVNFWQDRMNKREEQLIRAGQPEKKSTLERWEKKIDDDLEEEEDDDDEEKDGKKERNRAVQTIDADKLRDEFLNEVMLKYNALMGKAVPSVEDMEISCKDKILVAQYYDARCLLTDDIITCGRDVGEIDLNITWVDQDWGNMKGQIWMRVLAVDGTLTDTDCFGVCTHAQENLQKKIDAKFLPKKGDILSFVRYIGGGGGHELKIKEFKANIKWSKK